MNPALASYAAAVFSLYLQAIERGVSPPLRDVECLLCEDSKTVLLIASDGRDGWIHASFELEEKTDDATFDPSPYRDAIENR